MKQDEKQYLMSEQTLFNPENTSAMQSPNRP